MFVASTEPSGIPESSSKVVKTSRHGAIHVPPVYVWDVMPIPRRALTVLPSTMPQTRAEVRLGFLPNSGRAQPIMIIIPSGIRSMRPGLLCRSSR
jgi:hypothetical protein